MREDTTSLRPAIEGAIHIFGGIRVAAAAADIDPSNLSKYVRHGIGISHDGLRRLERALGRPDGQVDPSRVLVLRPKKLNVHLANALSWYFPDGAEIARASWSGFGWEHVIKVLKVDLGARPGNGLLACIWVMVYADVPEAPSHAVSFARLWAVQINAHSQVTFSTPRRRSWRKPRAALICPNTGSTMCFRSR